MHSSHLSLQGFQGKVGSKGDVVSRCFAFLNWIIRNILHIIKLYFSFTLLTNLLYGHPSSPSSLFFFPSVTVRVILVLRD